MCEDGVWGWKDGEEQDRGGVGVRMKCLPGVSETAMRVLRKASLESSKEGETVNSSFTTYQTCDSGNVTSLNLSLPALLTTGKTASHLPGELEKQMR